MSVTTVVVVGTSRPQALVVAVGGDQTTQLRFFDEAFITNFNPPEPDQWPTTEQPRRWSKSTWRISWPNAGRGWWISHISINTTPRPSDNPALIDFVSPNIRGVTLPNAVRHMQLLTRSRNETPVVSAQMTPLIIAGDNRDLGIVVTQIGLTPLGQITRLQLIIALCVLCLVVGLTSKILLPTYWWIVLIINNVLILITQQTHAEWWLVHTHTLLAGSLVGSVFLSLPFFKKLPSTDALILGVMGSGIAAQLTLINSPWLRSSDILMHIRMLNQVLSGNLLFTAQLPCEAGGQVAPYPIISYLLATPFAIWSNERWWHMAVLQSGAFIAHGFAILYATQVLRSYRLSPYLLAIWAAIALSSPFLIRALHIGEVSNAWAHALYIIAVMSWFDQRHDWRTRLLLSTLVMMTHTGITITYLATMAIFVGWQWFVERKFPRTPAFIVAASAGIGGLLYYSQYVVTVLGSPDIAGCPPNYPIAVRFSTVADMWVWPLVISALGGFWMSMRTSMRHLIVIGVGAAGVALAMLLVRDQTVRWALALTPFVALSASIWLWHIAHKYSAGRILAISIVLFSIWTIYVDRWEQVIRYLHD
jgi:hypothetical protein